HDRDPDVWGHVGLVGNRPALLANRVSCDAGRYVAPEASGSDIMFLKRDLPVSRMEAEDLIDCRSADALPASTASHEELGHQASLGSQTGDQRESHRARAVVE